MANISSASGYVRFSKAFAGKYGEKIKEWIESVMQNGGCYGFTYIDEYVSGGTEYNFCGEGRWTFDSTLNNWGLSTYDHKKNETVDILRPALAESGDFIEVEFEDYEPGCEVLYGETVHISAAPGMNKPGQYIVETVKEKDISFTHRSVIAEKYEDGFDLRNKDDLNDFIDYANSKGGDFKKYVKQIIKKINEDPAFDGCTYEWEADEWEYYYDEFLVEIKEEEETNIVHRHAFA